MEDFIIFLQQYAVFPIAIICYGIGYLIKHFIEKLPNKYIPLILTICGILLNLAFNGWVFTPEVILVGAGSGLAATGGFEAVRELVGKKNK